MRRLALILSILVVAAAPVVAAGGYLAPPTVSAPEIVYVEPGGNATVTIAVSNPGEAVAMYKVQVRWIGDAAGKLSGKNFMAELSPGCTKKFNVTITVPPDREPGFYTLGVWARRVYSSATYLTGKPEATITVAVSGVGNRALRLVDIREGGFTVEYRIDNLLDEPVTGTLHVEVRKMCCDNELVTVKDVPLTMRPGSSATGSIDFSVPTGGYVVTSTFIYGGGETGTLAMKAYAGKMEISFSAKWDPAAYNFRELGNDFRLYYAIRNTGTVPIKISVGYGDPALGFIDTVLMPGESYSDDVYYFADEVGKVTVTVWYGYGDYVKNETFIVDPPPWHDRHPLLTAGAVVVAGVFSLMLLEMFTAGTESTEE